MMSRNFRFGFCVATVAVLVLALVGYQPAYANGGCSADNIIFSEIDYDNPSTDTAEFIELRIVNATTLSDCELRLVNGTGPANYEIIDLTGTYSAGDYVVIGSTNVSGVDLTIGGTCSQNCIQNGPDGFALVNTSGGGNSLVWFYSYGGDITNYDPGDGSTNASVRLKKNNGSVNINDDGYANSIHNGPDAGVYDCYHDTPNPGNPGPNAVALVSLSAHPKLSWPVVGLSLLLMVGIFLFRLTGGRKFIK